MKYWKTGYEDYKITANILRSEIYKNFSPDESLLLNILSETIPFDYYKPQKSIEEALNFYGNSTILNAMYIYFSYMEWEKTKELSKLKKIMTSIQKIEEKYTKTPFSSYYHALILWNSTVYQNKQKAYTELKNTYSQYKDNQKILELLIEFSYSFNNYKEVIKYNDLYKTFSKKTNKILILIAKSYQKEQLYNNARAIIQNIIKNTNKKNILSSSFEILGDISNTSAQKINYYKLSLKSDPKNYTVLRKIGETYYTGNEKNLKLARIYLSKSLIFNPNQPETLKILSKIQRNYRITAFFSYVFPMVLISIFFIFILFYKKKNKELIVEKVGEEIHVKTEIIRSEDDEQ